MVPWVCLQSVIVAFSCYTLLLLVAKEKCMFQEIFIL